MGTVDIFVGGASHDLGWKRSHTITLERDLSSVEVQGNVSDGQAWRLGVSLGADAFKKILLVVLTCLKVSFFMHVCIRVCACTGVGAGMYLYSGGSSSVLLCFIVSGMISV